LLTLPCQGNCALLGEAKIPLPAGVVSPKQVVLGIRPEHVALARTETPQVATVEGKIFLVENLGMQNLISVQVPHQQSQIRLRALLPTDQKWDGEAVTLALPLDTIHWFDVETGDRLNP